MLNYFCIQKCLNLYNQLIFNVLQNKIIFWLLKIVSRSNFRRIFSSLQRAVRSTPRVNIWSWIPKSWLSLNNHFFRIHCANQAFSTQLISLWSAKLIQFNTYQPFKARLALRRWARRTPVFCSKRSTAKQRRKILILFSNSWVSSIFPFSSSWVSVLTKLYY